MARQVLTIPECLELIYSSAPSRNDVSYVMNSLVLILQSDEKVHMSDIAAAIEAINKVVIHLYDKSEEFEEKLKKLEKMLEERNQKLKTLEYLEDGILLGQVASKLEKKIVECILQGVDVITDKKFVTLNKLETALINRQSHVAKKMFAADDQINKADENRERLENDLGIEYDGLRYAIECFKQGRNQKAHPDIPLDDVYKHFTSESCHLEDEDKRLGKTMLDTLRDKFNVSFTGTY